MLFTLITLANILLASMLFYLWFFERRKFSKKKAFDDEFTVSDGARAQFEMIGKKSEYNAITKKLFEVGELRKDPSGYWVWSQTGEILGTKLLKVKFKKNELDE